MMKKMLLPMLTVAVLTGVSPFVGAVELIQDNGDGAGDTVGSVSVVRNAGTLTVTLATDSPYLIVEAHAAAALDCDDLPQNKNGNPKVGKFESRWTSAGFPGSDEIPLILDATEYSEDAELCVAAHAVVYNSEAGGTDEEAFFNSAEGAWGDGEAFPGKNWATHFVYTPPVVATSCNDGTSCTVFRSSVLNLTGDLVTEASTRFGLSAASGLEAGDQICQRLADDAGIGNPRVYKAWLSDSTASPATRFQHAAVPYEDVTGVRIADDWSDLTDGAIATTIYLNEYGFNFANGSFHAWTGTLRDGMADTVGSGSFCNDWSSASSELVRTGRWASADRQWTESTLYPCDKSLSQSYLMCFEQ